MKSFMTVIFTLAIAAGSYAQDKKSEVPILTDKEIKPLLMKNACIGCHTKDKKLIGPAFTEIAKRNYSNERILELIYKPEPKNWPEYKTPMAPLAFVKKEDGLKLAAWINSLKVTE